MSIQPPVILLVCANDRIDPSRHLRNLYAELTQIHDALRPAEQAGLCEVLTEANADADRIFSVFQDAGYRHRIAILHYAGHADESLLELESASGGHGPAYAAGLAAFLREQGGLQLVFLNGCSTAPQVQGLIDANCPAVIATSQAIDDELALNFAKGFYKALAGGAGLKSAFRQAEAEARTKYGDSTRGLYWNGATERTQVAQPPFPWELATAPDADDWKLLKDPLLGLPKLPDDIVPPESGPFRRLNSFERSDALVFFGRSREIRDGYDLITAADSSPILLLYGQSGVGKSSLLAAGLLPRLEFSHDVHYLRRDRSLGLLGTLLQYLQPGNDPPEMAWRRIEAAEGRPLVLVLDQAEEAFTRPVPDLPDEIKIFANGLRQIFTQPDARPQGRLILGFCKEWLAEIATALNDQGLRWEHQFLKALDRNGIIDAVTGPTRSERLCRKYRLGIEEGLAEEIADDLLVDPDSPVAPTLQILLTKLWEEAKERNREDPRFDRALYQKLRKGSALGPFIDEQLAGLEKVRAGDLRSGLALDLLAYHTTPKGTAEQHTDEDLQQHYCHIKDRVAEIVQWFKGGFVLTDLHTEQAPIKGSRLAHDTLAPFVRERFDRSDWPGQRARRILENRAVDWGKGQTGPVLDDTDLDLVEKGAAGMRCLEPDEERLIAASRRARNWRRALSGFFVAALVVAAVSVLYQWQQTESQKRIAIARLQTYEAVKVAEKNPIRALLLAAEAVKRPFDASGIRFGDAETVLRERIAATGGIPFGGDGLALGFDHQGLWLATGRADHAVLLWDLRSLASKPQVRLGHQASIQALAFSPDGKWLATIGLDDVALLWDIQNPKTEPRRLGGQDGRISSLAFHPAGGWLATGAVDGTICVLDLGNPDAKPIRRDGDGIPIAAIAFDGKSRWLAAGSLNSIVYLWDLWDPGYKMYKLPGYAGPLKSLSFDPQGHWLATNENVVARLWDLQHPEVEPRVLRGHEGFVTSLAFDLQGRWVATGSDNSSVFLWDLQNPEGEPREVKGHRSSVVSLAFDPQGRWFGSGSEDRTARLWDLQDFETEPRVLRGHEGSVQSLVFDPAGHWLATGGKEDTARLWDLDQPESEPRVLIGNENRLRHPSFDPLGRWLAARSDDRTIHLWNLEQPGTPPRVLHGQETGLDDYAFDPSGRWLAARGEDRTVSLWDLQQSDAEPRILRLKDGEIGSFVFDPFGQWLVTRTDKQEARLWNLQHSDSEPRVLPGTDGSILDAPFAFGLNDGWLASGGRNNAALLWDLRQPEVGPRQLDGHTKEIDDLAIDPQGRWLVSGSWDKTARIWDLHDRETTSIQLTVNDGGIESFVLAPDGRWLVTWAEGKDARLWDLEHLRAEPRVLPGHKLGTWSVAFDPKGRWVANEGLGETVLLWDLQHPSPAVPLGGHNRVGLLVFDPDGRWFVTTDSATARLWDLQHLESGARVLHGGAGGMKSVAFDPGGRWLATESADGIVRLWRLHLVPLLDLACRTAGRNLTLGEWQQHVGGIDYQVTCTQFPSGEILAEKAASGSP